MDILHIDLWKLYITYIRETKAPLPNYRCLSIVLGQHLIINFVHSLSREKLRNAYEFTLEHMGLDFHSSPIWMEYIEFLHQEYVGLHGFGVVLAYC